MCDRKVVFRRGVRGLVQFSHQTVSVLLAYRQVEARQAEAGGLLLGRIMDGTDDLLVDEATTPTQLDRRSRFSFFRPRKAAQAIVEARWNASKGTRNFLGEWHSHPEPTPQPSICDRANWKRVTRKAVYEQDALVFVVLGTVELGAWEIDRDGVMRALGAVRIEA